MSPNEQENGKTVDIDFSALDQELARMAQETPDVPEDFHARWTQAVREEAAAWQDEETAPEMTRAERRKAEARKQRRYLISAAAAFVLVIGIAILMQNWPDNPFTRVRKTETPVVTAQPADETEAPVPVPEAETQQEAAEEAAAAEENAMPEASKNANSGSAAKGTATDSATYAGEAGHQAAREYESAEESEESAADDTAYPETLSFVGYAGESGGGNQDGAQAAGALAAEESDGAYYDAEAEEAEEAYYDEAEEYAAAEPAMPAATAAPTPSPEPTPEPTAEPTAVPETQSGEAVPAENPEKKAGAAAVTEKAEETAAENPSFLQRLWDLILKITPWALGIVVLALFLVTYVIRKKPHKRQ